MQLMLKGDETCVFQGPFTCMLLLSKQKHNVNHCTVKTEIKLHFVCQLHRV